MEKPIYAQIEEYLDYCRARQFTKQTMDTKTRVLTKFAELELVDDMQELTNRDINKWMSMQSSGVATGNIVSGRTINSRLNHIVAFIKYLRDMDYDISVKTRLIEPAKEKPPRRSWFTREQIERVLKNAKPMEKLLISLTFDSGLRATELRNLRLKNINGREMNIVGKGNKAGTVFMTPRTRLWMNEWIDNKGITDYLWPSPAYGDGRPYSIDELRYRMRREFERAGIEGFYLHAMRHSFATDIQTRGASISQAQRLLRHSNSATTEVYLHALDNGMIGVYDQLKLGHTL
ncbi:site-specific integrase [Candidatus Saccharibacteria bacterium oral taxon 488]|nr:site-specific integrase [Candidatus Saccharibacteria bacterium oral taxon 488]